MGEVGLVREGLLDLVVVEADEVTSARGLALRFEVMPGVRQGHLHVEDRGVFPLRGVNGELCRRGS